MSDDMTAQHVKLLNKLTEDLRHGKTQPPLVRHGQSYREARAGMVKEWFHLARRRRPKHYPRYVRRFEQANLEYLRLPPVQRQSFPLCPPIQPEDRNHHLYINDLPVLSEMKPAAGGRRPLEDIQERNDIIRDCKGRGLSHYEACKELDQAKVRPLAAWEGTTWRFLYKHDPQRRGLIDRMFSKVALKHGRKRMH